MQAFTVPNILVSLLHSVILCSKVLFLAASIVLPYAIEPHIPSQWDKRGAVGGCLHLRSLCPACHVAAPLNCRPLSSVQAHSTETIWLSWVHRKDSAYQKNGRVYVLSWLVSMLVLKGPLPPKNNNKFPVSGHRSASKSLQWRFFF